MPDSAPAISATYGSVPSRVLQLLAEPAHSHADQQDQPVSPARRPDRAAGTLLSADEAPAPRPPPPEPAGLHAPSSDPAVLARAEAGADRRRRAGRPPKPAPTGTPGASGTPSPCRRDQRAGAVVPCPRRPGLARRRRRRRRPRRPLPDRVRHLHRPVAAGHEGLAAELRRARDLHRRPGNGLRLRQPVQGLGLLGRRHGLVPDAHLRRAPGDRATASATRSSRARPPRKAPSPRPRPSPTRPASALAKARRSTTTWRPTTRPTPAA